MSRSYEFAVEVSGAKENTGSDVSDTIANEMGASDVDSWEDDVIYFNGICSLCEGESEEEAHDRIVQDLRLKHPEVTKIETRWRCIEYQQWDNIMEWDIELEINNECDNSQKWLF